MENDNAIKKFKCDVCKNFRKIVVWNIDNPKLGFCCNSCLKKYKKLKDDYYPIAKKMRLI